ncbi:cell division protein FtsL [Vibrio sp. vnigr-6D03]|uniref:Cell division protein FtsL n=1 Tax=Vibrio penaeicida TaxID=104609 RepID=A0AAV5NV53_9VIBR|nr:MULTISPECIES: cell division protein FtsL [Vibrio]MDP2573837.1 cell division protein FtsL [Vibrio penaeicida]PKF79207.1 cell division protein FtsL [Vibrio sp. vnigr-6D03]RTZ22944.1 cell division protein FtsL [Vibrio penaeicida]GLQ73876.1 cell division protein FtsL [Vibrio penaeicida]
MPSAKDASPNLAKLIFIDIVTVGRVPATLLLLAFASAMWVVHTTHDTRAAIHQRDSELVERDRLDNEWRNLILEENALAEHSRVQEMAQKELDMKRPDADKEVIVSFQ